VSLGVAVLRLTMAGMVFASVGALNFFLSFVVSEIIGTLAGISTKGVMRMSKNIAARVVKFWNSHLRPYEVTSLTSA
jgi:hypothetical protein